MSDEPTTTEDYLALRRYGRFATLIGALLVLLGLGPPIYFLVCGCYYLLAVYLVIVTPVALYKAGRLIYGAVTGLRRVETLPRGEQP